MRMAAIKYCTFVRTLLFRFKEELLSYVIKIKDIIIIIIIIIIIPCTTTHAGSRPTQEVAFNHIYPWH
jgi:hypothetical protein